MKATEPMTLQVPTPIMQRLQATAEARYTSRQQIILQFLIANIDVLAPVSEAA